MRGGRRVLTVRWPHNIQRKLARGSETRISKRPARVSSSDEVLRRTITKMSTMEKPARVMSVWRSALTSG